MLRDPRRRAMVELRRRLKIVNDYLDGRRAGMSEANAADRSATRFHVSISTVRRWARLFREGAAAALMPACGPPSDAQLAARYKSTLSFAVISVILAIRAHLGWCGQRIAEELERRGIARISHPSVYRVLSRYHVPVRTYHPVGRSAGIHYRKQRVLAPNWVWHIDFAGPWRDADGVSYSILVVIDAYSRMLLALECVEQQSSQNVESLLERLFEQHGKPKVIITDNGRAFAPSKSEWEHRFGAFLLQHGVEHRRSAPFYPQTNGKVEAMIKTIEREFLTHLGWKKGFWSWNDVQVQSRRFMGWYNFYRPHGALGYRTPAERFAGIRMPCQRLDNLFALPCMGVDELATTPEINNQNRPQALALVPLV